MSVIDATNLRDALGRFATGVTVVTTRSPDGEPVGVTASSFNSVSLDPPLILWSLGKQAYSYPVFMASGHFAVHVLNADQVELSNRFARASSAKFEGLALQPGLDGTPLLPDCAAIFECTIEHRYEGGDHVILVGRVEKLHLGSAGMAPLLFHQGRYAQLADVTTQGCRKESVAA